MLPLSFGLGGEEVIGGDVDRASPGDMDRIEVLEGLRWKGESSPDGMVSSFCFKADSCCCVESCWLSNYTVNLCRARKRGNNRTQSEAHVKLYLLIEKSILLLQFSQC